MPDDIAGSHVRWFRLRVAGAAVVAALAMTPLTACSDETHAVLHTAKGDFTFHVEIADDDAERAKGLMFRQELADDAGMLFDFGQERETAFWMQNTFIPLDMVFISAAGVVKTIHANARPMDTTSIPSGAPVRFVLEIPAGRAEEIGLAIGDKLENDRVEAAGQ
jgi:uncharacterized membrane protein (UPF0127 family)